ncbi:hypothetical protein E4U31_004311 [Claviceps sp. LM219 group G6]|nr:hypothetical protein E4U31_004311 [Claviceps sp. LM219 group G6]
MPEQPSLPVTSDKVWVSLITNAAYLPGLLTLAHSLRAAHSKYPLLALYTPSLSPSALSAIQARKIPCLAVPFLAPRSGKRYDQDPRFNDCWTKLVVFQLTQFSRVVCLDSDMVVRRNMDELMEVELDEPPAASSSADTGSGTGTGAGTGAGAGTDTGTGADAGTGSGSGTRLFAASHACICNPLKRSHYPSTWTPSNCAFTAQHADPALAQIQGVEPSRTLGALNSGLLVVRPSEVLFQEILARMDSHGEGYTFPDQDLLADLYEGRWVALPYVYNALKTMRRGEVHGAMWRDESVKNVHFILSPKPWEEVDEEGVWRGGEETHRWWVEANAERLREEREMGIEN